MMLFDETGGYVLGKNCNNLKDPLGDALGIDRERLRTLCSCRLPRDQAELELIAARIGWEVGRLAGLLGVHYTGETGS